MIDQQLIMAKAKKNFEPPAAAALVLVLRSDRLRSLHESLFLNRTSSCRATLLFCASIRLKSFCFHQAGHLKAWVQPPVKPPHLPLVPASIQSNDCSTASPLPTTHHHWEYQLGHHIMIDLGIALSEEAYDLTTIKASRQNPHSAYHKCVLRLSLPFSHTALSLKAQTTLTRG